MMPTTPNPAAIELHDEVARAVRLRDEAAAERAMVPDEVPVVTIRAGIDGGLLPDTVQRIPEIVALGAAAARAVLAAHPELLGSSAGVPAYPPETGQAGTRTAPRLQELSHAVGRRLHTHRAPTARAPH